MKHIINIEKGKPVSYIQENEVIKLLRKLKETDFNFRCDCKNCKENSKIINEIIKEKKRI